MAESPDTLLIPEEFPGIDIDQIPPPAFRDAFIALKKGMNYRAGLHVLHLRHERTWNPKVQLLTEKQFYYLAFDYEHCRPRSDAAPMPEDPQFYEQFDGDIREVARNGDMEDEWDCMKMAMEIEEQRRREPQSDARRSQLTMSNHRSHQMRYSRWEKHIKFPGFKYTHSESSSQIASSS